MFRHHKAQAGVMVLALPRRIMDQVEAVERLQLALSEQALPEATAAQEQHHLFPAHLLHILAAVVVALMAAVLLAQVVLVAEQMAQQAMLHHLTRRVIPVAAAAVVVGLHPQALAAMAATAAPALSS